MKGERAIFGHMMLLVGLFTVKSQFWDTREEMTHTGM